MRFDTEIFSYYQLLLKSQKISFLSQTGACPAANLNHKSTTLGSIHSIWEYPSRLRLYWRKFIFGIQFIFSSYPKTFAADTYYTDAYILAALCKRENGSSLLLAITWRLGFPSSKVQKRLKANNTMQQRGTVAFLHKLTVPGRVCFHCLLWKIIALCIFYPHQSLSKSGYFIIWMYWSSLCLLFWMLGSLFVVTFWEVVKMLRAGSL